MKAIKLLALFCSFTILLTSCYDSVQRIEFKDNGGGTIAYSIDFSKGIGMLKAFIPDSVQQSVSFSRKIDTTVTMIETVPDSVKKQKSEDALKMLASTTMKAQVDMMNNLMKINFNGQASNEKELRFWLQNFDKEASFGGAMPAGGAQFSGNTSGLTSDYFTYEYRKGYFKRKVDTVLFRNNMKQNEAVYDMVNNAGMDANFTLELIFPKPIKRYNASNMTVSGNKKSGVLKYSMKEAIINPQIMNVEVEF
ncbi:hypothetical protein [Solitalea lacus]|uniref:hypothetical protein n=1 Tax=Solitalea lacus TaxID=2911172 RepID=UPI001EDBA22B|nr:hypothetical protein [Solitalea lacus]UKJ07851.1 hypothetical protein L2B55_01490 [Solitalea lacus]